VTLCDAGPLIALIDHRQPARARCVEALPSIEPPLLTTWACLTEAMYLLGREGGWIYQEQLWSMLASGTLELFLLDATDAPRCQALMARYQNVPMDLADASLIVLAEHVGVRRVFTLDSDFYIYRTADGGALDIIPELAF